MKTLKIALTSILIVMVILLCLGYQATQADKKEEQTNSQKETERVTTGMVERQREYAKSEGKDVTKSEVENSKRMDDLILNLSPIEKDTISRLLNTNETYLTQTSVIDYIQVETAGSEKAGVIVGVIYNQVGRTGESTITLMVINSTEKDYIIDTDNAKVSYQGKDYRIYQSDGRKTTTVPKQSVYEITYSVETKSYTQGQLPYDENTDIYFTGHFKNEQDTYYMLMKPSK